MCLINGIYVRHILIIQLNMKDRRNRWIGRIILKYIVFYIKGGQDSVYDNMSH